MRFVTTKDKIILLTVELCANGTCAQEQIEQHISSIDALHGAACKRHNQHTGKISAQTTADTDTNVDILFRKHFAA